MSRSHYALTGAALLLALASCSEPTTPPDTPQPAEPALAATATALAFSQVSGGAAHTCGITSDNRAYCWGNGWLGDGTYHQDPGSTRPVAVAGDLRFVQITAGGAFHMCGVTTDHQAYCWGENIDGQIGDGSTTNAATPVLVAGGHLFFHVDADGFHTCGLSYPDQLAYCWGSNQSGELGDGTQNRSTTPVAVAGAHQFRQVSAGQNHSCGVTPSGPAYCWGNNVFGQVGDGDGSTVDMYTTPVLVAGGKLYRQIDGGNAHTCAVTTSFQAYCWGSGRSGQVGDGKTFLRFAPRAVAGGLSFERVTAGGEHTCGETTNNRAYCWGDNSFGGLGDGTFTQRLTPVAVAGGLFFSQVSAGQRYTCGRTSSAVAYCWGYNSNGQLGDGSTTNRTTPVPVADPI
jgi:alpha-tubulin suppressor-like RCC1 family protein